MKDLTAPKYEAIFDKTGVSARSFMCKKSCMTELSGQLGTIFITRLLVGNITEVVLPAVRIKQAQAAARKVEVDSLRERLESGDTLTAAQQGKLDEADAEDARLNVLAERLATSLQRSTEDFVLNGGGNSFDPFGRGRSNIVRNIRPGI